MLFFLLSHLLTILSQRCLFTSHGGRISLRAINISGFCSIERPVKNKKVMQQTLHHKKMIASAGKRSDHSFHLELEEYSREAVDRQTCPYGNDVELQIVGFAQ